MRRDENAQYVDVRLICKDGAANFEVWDRDATGPDFAKYPRIGKRMGPTGDVRLRSVFVVCADPPSAKHTYELDYILTNLADSGRDSGTSAALATAEYLNIGGINHYSRLAANSYQMYRASVRMYATSWRDQAAPFDPTNVLGLLTRHFPLVKVLVVPVPLYVPFEKAAAGRWGGFSDATNTANKFTYAKLRLRETIVVWVNGIPPGAPAGTDAARMGRYEGGLHNLPPAQSHGHDHPSKVPNLTLAVTTVHRCGGGGICGCDSYDGLDLNGTVVSGFIQLPSLGPDGVSDAYATLSHAWLYHGVDPSDFRYITLLGMTRDDDNFRQVVDRRFGRQSAAVKLVVFEVVSPVEDRMTPWCSAVFIAGAYIVPSTIADDGRDYLDADFKAAALKDRLDNGPLHRFPTAGHIHGGDVNRAPLSELEPPPSAQRNRDDLRLAATVPGGGGAVRTTSSSSSSMPYYTDSLNRPVQHRRPAAKPPQVAQRAVTAVKKRIATRVVPAPQQDNNKNNNNDDRNAGMREFEASQKRKDAAKFWSNRVAANDSASESYIDAAYERIDKREAAKAAAWTGPGRRPASPEPAWMTERYGPA